jgi:small redox-active disulfide protein 2
MKRVQVLGPGCPTCAKLLENVRHAVSELGIEAVVEKVSDIEDILDFAALMTPGLAIDGELKMVGKVPSVEELKRLLA